ncbi:MAG: 5-methyltetrahydropteroyltriglutamate--homocysteine methyltransferase [Candidatus Xenobia bacterium]
MQPDVSFDGGDLDCGNGLLLLIRQHIDPLRRGQLLEIRSTEISVDEDLPAWCRLTGNELVSVSREGSQRRFVVCKGSLQERTFAAPAAAAPPPVAALPELAPFSVMGIGSWPRPRWMLQAIHEHVAGQLPDAEFQATADDAVRLAVAAQERGGVDVVSDGEQRRDSYASFVGSRLEGCQLIPLADLTAMVDDPAAFAEELRALDVPAHEVRHPVAFKPLRRTRPLAVHELDFARSVTPRPVKVALPGPYLLTRTLWLECLETRPYATRDALAEALIPLLRAEIAELLEHGAILVQLDEPVLTEVVFTGAKTQRSFMCGALSEKGDPQAELAFAARLLSAVLDGFPRQRLALHVCRGNWTRDEKALLAGPYTPLLPLLQNVPVGTLFLEFATPRAGELEVLRELPQRIGLGVVNPKLDAVEDVDAIVQRVETAVHLLGSPRLLLNPDCGFATFADNPVASARVAEQKLQAMAAARDRLNGQG